MSSGPPFTSTSTAIALITVTPLTTRPTYEIEFGLSAFDVHDICGRPSLLVALTTSSNGIYQEEPITRSDNWDFAMAIHHIVAEHVGMHSPNAARQTYH